MQRLLPLFLILPLLTPAQTLPVIPAKTVEQTRVPVFAEKNETDPLANFRLHLSYQSASVARLQISGDLSLDLPSGNHTLELRYEHASGQVGQVSAELDKAVLLQAHKLPGSEGGENFESADKRFKCDGDFTVSTRFSTRGSGTLFSKCSPKGKWSENAKVLFIRGGKLVYDIGWVGEVSARKFNVNDGKPHHVVLMVRDRNAELFIDGKSAARKTGFTARDEANHVFKVGRAAKGFAGDFKGGTIQNLRYWSRSFEGAEQAALIKGNVTQLTPPDFDWGSTPPVETFAGHGYPGLPTSLKLIAQPDFKKHEAWVQPLERADHAALIVGWNDKTLAEGKAIYHTLCVTCHGTPEQEGTLPTALKFHAQPFKNGADPYRMYQTLTKGYGLMIPQPQYTAAQKYAVIQYIREALVKPHNPSQYAEPDAEYRVNLPRKLETVQEAASIDIAGGGRPYERMDFGPSLMWTFQVNKERDLKKANIAQKGIAVRLDAGPGGVSRGRAWMVYDEGTMRVAAGYTGKFVDWRGIAFDGSHGTHTSIAGEPLWINPDTPAWQHPVRKTWKDERVEGRDGRRFGNLSRDWVQYRGQVVHGTKTILHYSVGEAEIHELPGIIHYGSSPVFTRTLNIGKSSHDLLTNLAPNDDKLAVVVEGEGAELIREGETIQLRIAASATPTKVLIALSQVDAASLGGLVSKPIDLAPLLKGGPPRFGGTVVKTEGKLGSEHDAFAVDTLTVPNQGDNPWHAWMRLGGFDFFPDNPDRAAVCTWLGDVWLVDGVTGDLKELRWRRICSGLFQPLGLKVYQGKIYVTCRDQLARLHDLNGDEEIDYIEAFNNDHQVTEHFHEFAMGLQVDAKGNFYYAKSARHAKTAVVPHHGTLLRVAPDGSRTDIVATGFRAANGVCLNPDGTWIVTDQEGHWNPKNRINYVREDGFYGNMFGYHDVTDSADTAMEQPLAWITNGKDRSPAELLWVPKGIHWGGLDGTLLNLSYGYGMVYTVPHEIVDGQAQGGVCEFPIERQPTGLHRGRFHPENKQLYAVGMFAWAGSQRADGGFFRIRATGKPAWLPTKLQASGRTVTITFSDELPEGGEFGVTTWDLKRSASYGSKHYNTKKLAVEKFEVDGHTVRLDIPELKPTWGMEIKCTLGNGRQRVIHNSIHKL